MKHLEISTLSYHVIRSVQRFSLLAAGLITVMYWAIHIMVESGFLFISEESNSTVFTDTSQMNAQLEKIANFDARTVQIWLVVAGLLTVILLLFKRGKQNDKRLIIGSAIFLVICSLSIVFIETLTRLFSTVYR